MTAGPALPTEEELESRVRELFAAWGALDDGMAHVEVVWNSRLRTTAGRVFMKRLQIQLNPRLLARVPERIDEVLAHEAAHLVTYRRHGSAVSQHGGEWQGLMESAGFAGAATHDFPIEGLQPRRSYFLHRCKGCGSEEIRDTAQATKLCGCAPELAMVFRAPRTERGLRALQELPATQSGG